MNELKQGIQKILDSEAEIAKENELLIGIDPKSYLGQELLHQSRTIIALRSDISDLKTEVKELKKMTAEFINRP